MSLIIHATSTSEEISLRPLRLRDRAIWEEVRRKNREWLNPWEATRPEIDNQGPLPSYWAMVRQSQNDAKSMRSLSLGIWIKDGASNRFVGQITLGGIVLGAYRGGYIGYWIDSGVANRGITTAAVVALTDYAFRELSLHRIEITMRPENAASQRVAEKAGFSYEGLRLRYLHIDGEWRDHMIFVRENPEIR